MTDPLPAPHRPAYLDHAATTPMVPEAVAVLTEMLGRTGNPSSLHASGRAARRVVEESRELIAERLGARPSEVVFTSGGTEANNLAIKGLFWSRHAQDPARRRLLFSAIEHHALLDPVLWLGKEQGADVVTTAVDRDGIVRLDDLRRTIESDPGSIAAITTMWANNEMGSVQPVDEVVAMARPHGIPVHSDAVQAAGHLPLDFAASGLEAMTVTAHKLGGPIGVGALLAVRELELMPLLHGGGQERDVRSGTLGAPLIASFAAAVDVSVRRREAEATRLEQLRARLVEGLVELVPEAIVNGPADPALRLPHVAHVTFPGCDADAMLMLFDARGIEVSTGSACTAGVPQPSHVLLAMGYDEESASSSLRFSLGHTSAADDVDRVLAALPEVHARASAARAVRAR
ncbi:cysteine desulfurase family protein [Aeromicrobium alkaliterrae]|uniref:Cysteine desulfurase family protein n=1 Tax=Aeromicrobium alkaliterrae TaxID=302168 RepID=A0ABN2JHS2_9ACTN